MAQSFPMNSGEATCSYTNNSTMQRDGASAVMDLIREAVIKNLDTKKPSVSGSGSDSDSSLTKFVIADLGCSVGPNTFYAVQNLIGAVQQKCNSINIEFQVFFNDQIAEKPYIKCQSSFYKFDMHPMQSHTLFASLPHPRNYLAAGVPGSLYGRIFPSSSVHIAYSSYAMHWMSKVPEAMRVKGSPAWNAGKIHYAGASDAVMKAYLDQFEEDMEVFLRARAQEIVVGGMVVILMLGVPLRDVEHVSCKMYALIGSILMDMVGEGLLEREKVESFNIPNFLPSVMEMRKVVEENGCFEIVKMETMEVKPPERAEVVVRHFRAIFEGIISNHFGNEIFEQVAHKFAHRFQFSPSNEEGFNGLLFAVLKRNNFSTNY